MNARTIEWYIEHIKGAESPDAVLSTWREAEEHLDVDELMKVHEACRSKIVKSIREVKNG